MHFNCEEMDIKKIFAFAKNEFIYGGHLLSLGAASIVFTSAVLLDTRITWDFLLVAYLIFYVIYAYNKLRELGIDLITNPKRTEHIEKYTKYSLVGLLIAVVVTVFILARYGNFFSMLFGITILVGGVLYTECFKKFTKNIVGFKSFYVSFIWAALVPFLALYYNLQFSISLFLMFLFVFLRLMVNTIFFDIKDIESDNSRHLKTVPIIMGEKGVLNFLQILNLLSFVPLVVGVHYKIIPEISLVLLIFSLYSFFYLYLVRSQKTNIQELSYSVVDGEYILWSLVLILIK